MSWKMKSEKLNELIREALFDEPCLELPVIEPEISMDRQYDILDDLIYDALLEEDYSPLPVVDQKVVQWLDWLEELEEKQLKSVANAHVQKEPEREEEKIVQFNEEKTGQQSLLEPKKCDTCDKSFFFPVNDRRHKWKHRDKNLEKNMKAERDQLRGYWEKLEHEKARKIMSIKDAVLPVDLKELQVNDIIEAVSRHIEALDRRSQCRRHNFLAKHLLRPMQGGDCPPLRLLFQALCFLSDENFLRGTLDPEMQRTVFPPTINMAKIKEQGLLASFEYLVEYCMMKAWTDDRNHNFAKLLKEEEEKAKNQTQSTASTSKANKPSASQRKKAKARKLKESKLSEICTEDNSSKDKKEHNNSDADMLQQNQRESKEREIHAEKHASECKKKQDSPATSSAVDATSSAVDATSSSSAVDATSSAVDGTSSAVAATSSPVDANSSAVDANSSAVDGTSSAVDANSSTVDAASSLVDATSCAVAATQSNPVTLIGNFVQVQDNTFQDKVAGTSETDDKAAGTLEKIKGTRWGDYEMDDDFSAFRLAPAFNNRGSSSTQPGTRSRDKFEETWKDAKTRHSSKRQQSNHNDMHARRVFQVHADQRTNTQSGLGSYADQRSNTQGGFKMPYNRSGTNDKGFGKPSASTYQISVETKPPAVQREPLSSKNTGLEWGKNPAIKGSKPAAESRSTPPAVERPLPPTSVWAENFNKNKGLAGAKNQIGEASNPSVESVQAESVPAENKDSKRSQGQTSSVVPTMSNKNVGPKGAEKPAKTSGQTHEKTKIPDNARRTWNVHNPDGHAHPVESKDSKPPQGRVVQTMSNKNKRATWAKEVVKTEETVETSGRTDEQANVPDNVRGPQNVYRSDGHAHPVVALKIEPETAADRTTDFDRAFSDYVRYLRQAWNAALASPDCIELEEYDNRMDIRDKPYRPGSP